MAEADTHPMLTDRPKKRKINGRKNDVLKKERLSAHTTGEDCRCERYKCFEVTTEAERELLITRFNALASKDEQDSFLSRLVTAKTVERRRQRQDSATHKPNDRSYNYCIPVTRGQKSVDIDVCFRGFISIFGVTRRRLETIKKALITTGFPPKDGRGKHMNRPHRFTEDEIKVIQDHISSFRGRLSHYCRDKTRKLYLPEELNISSMFGFFKETHPLSQVSYESYRKIFNGSFNIAFGYPRSDTCSRCDEYNARISLLEKQLSTLQEDTTLHREKNELESEKEIHQRKAETFYVRKRASKERSKTSDTMRAVAFDFQKDLHCPNKTTNDIYYRRQLSLHSFNVHDLGSDNVHLYVYDETKGKKGSDAVASMLLHYVKNVIPDNVCHIEFFCDLWGTE